MTDTGGGGARLRAVRAPALALLIPALLAGCATTGSSPFDGSEPGDTEVRFTILNQNYNDATVWALWDNGARNRLGSVTGNSARTFRARHRSDVVRFEVDFLAGGDYTTDSITVGPGDHVELRIQPRGG